MNTYIKKPNYAEISEILQFVLDNKYSDFYRKKYSDLTIDKNQQTNDEIFNSLPLLTKKELEDTHPDQRVFIDKEKINFVAYTSGTTSGKPLVMYFSEVDNYHFKPSLGLGVKRLLITYPPLNKNFGHTFVQQCKQANDKTTPVFADYQNLANSAVIADKTNADAIYATPTIAIELASHIKNYYDPSKIKLLALGSETLTDSHRKQLKLLYPNAKIANLYASSEIGQYILYPCKEIMDGDENTFHLLDDAVVSAELIDNELIVTYSKNKAIPLIRYKTGDSFEIVNDKCKCGLDGPILKWLGRKEIDKIRISGIEIHTEDVENVFSKISGHIGSQYQLHFYEIKDEGKNKVKIVIEIINPLGKESPVSNMIIEKVKNYLLDSWKLTPYSSLKDVISSGNFLEPEIKFVQELSFKSSKTRRLVNHIQ